jgi:hypothetical protein
MVAGMFAGTFVGMFVGTAAGIELLGRGRNICLLIGGTVIKEVNVLNG